jgi:hypothetical protein
VTTILQNTAYLMLFENLNDLLVFESVPLHLGTSRAYFIGKSHLAHGLVFGGKVTESEEFTGSRAHLPNASRTVKGNIACVNSQ